LAIVFARFGAWKARSSATWSVVRGRRTTGADPTIRARYLPANISRFKVRHESSLGYGRGLELPETILLLPPHQSLRSLHLVSDIWSGSQEGAEFLRRDF
jgi:hypothetical protein